jgi:hypothetical protein
VQGRITDDHLPEAEGYFPGIKKMYREMNNKPATFLDLLWQYEGARGRKSEAEEPAPRRRRRRKTSR